MRRRIADLEAEVLRLKVENDGLLAAVREHIEPVTAGDLRERVAPSGAPHLTGTRVPLCAAVRRTRVTSRHQPCRNECSRRRSPSVPEEPHASWVQVLRLGGDPPARAGDHLRRRAQRLRQSMSSTRSARSWRAGRQAAARRQDGRRRLRRDVRRPPLGRAEVVLTIDNSDGALPIEYAEVTISRTMFRNGGSEYAINGNTCRLIDVQELLSDSGIGREMHVIVGQGQLDSVLRATPEERRGFIEEAAGVLKHRKRKEKALRKLDATPGNLTRLNDVLTELRRQLKPLGRQAEVARRAAGDPGRRRDARPPTARRRCRGAPDAHRRGARRRDGSQGPPAACRAGARRSAGAETELEHRLREDSPRLFAPKSSGIASRACASASAAPRAGHRTHPAGRRRV